IAHHGARHRGGKAMSDITSVEAPANGRFSAGGRKLDWLARAGLPLMILAVVVFGTLTSPVFFTVGNFLNVLTNMSIVGIVVVAMTYVLVVGGLADLSVPATIACGAILSLALQQTL